MKKVILVTAFLMASAAVLFAQKSWTIVDGKLYLNYSKDVRTKWRENEKERIEKADKNWPSVKLQD